MKKVRNYFSPFLFLLKRFIKCYNIVKSHMYKWLQLASNT